jgi:hypothetical protein
MDEFEKDKLTIDIVWANIFGILILIPIAIIYGIPFYLLWSNDFLISNIKESMSVISPNYIFIGTLKMLLIMVFGIIIHELIHGIVWAMYSKGGFKSIKFGIMIKMLTPYCHCKEPLQVSHYILGAIMPAIVLGLIPAIVSILIGNFGLLTFGVFFTMAACGDFLVINLLKKENLNSLVQDHPSEAGCYIYRKKKQ